MLVLPIKKKWFDMILSGEKKEEYREIKTYYHNRFGNILLGYSLENCDPKLYEGIRLEIVFRNGYSYNSPSIKCNCTLNIGYGRKEWGAEEGKDYYVLQILEILEVRNYGK